MVRRLSVQVRFVRSAGSVDRVELIVELLETLKDLLHVTRWIYQVCDLEVIRACGLSEARAWNCHDSGLINHF